MGVKEQSCIECHGAELKSANDSHPKSKYADPRNADRLKMLAADNCLTCHKEHVPEKTQSMGVTLPTDYCYHCHQETLKERPSHKDFAFDSCANAGCHNYHDNSSLYEDFLVKHASEPRFKEPAVRPVRNLLAFLIESEQRKPKVPLAPKDADPPSSVRADEKLTHAWESSAHAKAAVNCNDCHMGPAAVGKTRVWVDKPGHSACATCHREEVDGFLGGHHGMRLAQNLSSMTPSMARLPMKAEAAHRQLTCSGCHGPHEFNTRAAAVESCLSCHNDKHSVAYTQSSHFTLWKAELKGEAPAGSGVSCATCHLPREKQSVDGVRRVLVQHNQNANLRPNEKMIRTVCLGCHGLEFSIDSLADTVLIETNFAGRPSRHVESIDLAVKRTVKTEPTKTKP